MTFCCALKCRDGLVAPADTQIVRGSEQVTRSKLTILHDRDESFFIMTSGLRSVRDMLMIYAEEALAAFSSGCDRLYQAANLLARSSYYGKTTVTRSGAAASGAGEFYS